MAGQKKSRGAVVIVFVIEGGRSRADVAAISAVATAVERAGAHVKVVRHGLGRLAGAGVRTLIRDEEPDVVVTTGATSTRDAEGLGRAHGFAVVCYYWPAGPIEDIHRRPRHRHKAPKRPLKISVPTHAVLGSALHKDVLQRYLGGPHKSVEAHILPPLLDEAAIAEAAGGAGTKGPTKIGVYGGHGRELPAASCQLIDLDAVPAASPASVGGARSELARLGECDAILILGCGTADEREAPRRCATALRLGKPVLVSGFGDKGDESPLFLPEFPTSSHGPLRVATAAELPAALARLIGDLPQLPRLASPEATAALAPDHVLAQHASLLMGIGKERHARPPTRDTVATRLLARLRTLLRRRRA